jgi:cytochrome c553
MARPVDLPGAAAVIALASLIGIPVSAGADTIDTTGQAPYEQCGYCHEYDGNSRMAAFPKLAGQHAAYLGKQLRDFRTGRREGTMQATAELLSDADIRAVAEYFSGQVPAVAAPGGVVAPAIAALYAQGDADRGLPACAGCHGRQGEGAGTVPRLAGQHGAYLAQQLEAFAAGRRANDPEGVMGAVAARLEADEIAGLTQYLMALDPAAEGLAAWPEGRGENP